VYKITWVPAAVARLDLYIDGFPAGLGYSLSIHIDNLILRKYDLIQTYFWNAKFHD